MTNIVKTAIAERTKLEAELAQNPLHKKIKMLNEIIANFEEPVTRKGTKKDKIHQLAKDCIASNGGYAKLAVIAEYVKRHGVQSHIGMLKSYVYSYKDLKPSRSKGFSIRN